MKNYFNTNYTQLRGMIGLNSLVSRTVAIAYQGTAEQSISISLTLSNTIITAHIEPAAYQHSVRRHLSNDWSESLFATKFTHKHSPRVHVSEASVKKTADKGAYGRELASQLVVRKRQTSNLTIINETIILKLDTCLLSSVVPTGELSIILSGCLKYGCT